MNKYQFIIGEQTKKIRSALGLTQAEFAKRFNKTSPRDLTITRVLVSKYERAEVHMPADKYLKLIDLNPSGNPLI